MDRLTLLAIAVLIGFGYVMMLAASPAVAERIGMSAATASSWKQVFFLLARRRRRRVGVSLLSPKGVRRLALAGCLIALALDGADAGDGVEIKGARRWISLPGMSLQPSEFLKPCFAVVAAWLLSGGQAHAAASPAWLIAFGLFGVILLLLKSQPDIGMLAVITAVFFAQLFVGWPEPVPGRRGPR